MYRRRLRRFVIFFPYFPFACFFHRLRRHRYRFCAAKRSEIEHAETTFEIESSAFGSRDRPFPLCIRSLCAMTKYTTII